MKIYLTIEPNEPGNNFVLHYFDEEGNPKHWQRQMSPDLPLQEIYDIGMGKYLAQTKPRLFKQNLNLLATHGAEFMWKQAEAVLNVTRDQIETFCEGGDQYYKIKKN